MENGIIQLSQMKRDENYLCYFVTTPKEYKGKNVGFSPIEPFFWIILIPRELLEIRDIFGLASGVSHIAFYCMDEIGQRF